MRFLSFTCISSSWREGYGKCEKHGNRERGLTTCEAGQETSTCRVCSAVHLSLKGEAFLPIWRFSLVSWTSQFGSLPSAVHLSLKGGNKTYCIFPVPRALNRYLRWAVLFLPSQFLQPLAIHTKQTCACSLFVYLFPLSHALYTYSVYCPVNCMFSVHCTCTGIYGILVALSCSCPVRFCTISSDAIFY